MEQKTPYIPDIKLVRMLEKVFDGDLNTSQFSSEEDFETYLCALAYGCIGKELFYDETYTRHIPKELLRNPEFMQGMLTYSVIEKINEAERILNSSEFEKNMKIDFSEMDSKNDYASIAFIIFYLTTKGYRVEWHKMSHAISPINVSNGPVTFKRTNTLMPEQLIENVKSDLNRGKTI